MIFLWGWEAKFIILVTRVYLTYIDSMINVVKEQPFQVVLITFFN